MRDKEQILHKVDSLIKEVKSIRLVVIEKDQRGYDKLLKKLRDAVLNAWDKKRKQAINEAIEYLVKNGEEKFTKATAAEINKILLLRLGSDLSKVMRKDIDKLTSETLKLGKYEVLKPLKIKLSFDVKDKGAVKILSKQNLFWIGEYYGENLKTKFDEITEGYFNSDKTIKEIAEDFKQEFQDLTNQGERYFYDLAEHQTNTVRELGKVNGFVTAGIEFYEIRAVMDDRTSDVCKRMNGVVFPVSRAIEYRDNILSLKDPEEIKKASPWLTPSQVQELPAENENLPPGLSVPPYHFRCRTLIVAHFKE